MIEADFEALVQRLLTSLPVRYRRYLDNVAILVADEPSPAQARKAGLRQGSLLLGLYEGVPRVAREGRPVAFPDTITLFRRALETIAPTPAALIREIRRTLIHEIGHHLGLNEQRVRQAARRHEA